jgi:hypothetical protein
MAARTQTKSARLRDALQRRNAAIVDEALWRELQTELGPVSAGYLRRLLRQSGVPLAPLVEGVRQDTFEDLERTLLALEREYEGGDEASRMACRREVIAAKDRARWALQRLADGDPKREVKQEMSLWMLTWLENPGVFAAWLALRVGQLGKLGADC